MRMEEKQSQEFASILNVFRKWCSLGPRPGRDSIWHWGNWKMAIRLSMLEVSWFFPNKSESISMIRFFIKYSWYSFSSSGSQVLQQLEPQPAGLLWSNHQRLFTFIEPKNINMFQKMGKAVNKVILTRNTVMSPAGIADFTERLSGLKVKCDMVPEKDRHAKWSIAHLELPYYLETACS